MSFNITGSGVPPVEIGTRVIHDSTNNHRFYDTIYGTVTHSGLTRAEAEKIARSDGGKPSCHSAIYLNNHGTYDVLRIDLVKSGFTYEAQKERLLASQGHKGEALRIHDQISFALRSSVAHTGFTFID